MQTNARRATLTLILLAGGAASPAWALTRPESPPPANLSGRAPARATLAALRGDGDAVGYVDPLTGTLRALYPPAGAALALDGPPELAARAFLKREAALLGAAASDIAELEWVATGADARGGPTLVRFRQMHEGLPVYASEVRLLVDRAGRVVALTSGLAPGLGPVPEAQLDAATAAGQAALDVGRAPGSLPPLTGSAARFRIADGGDPTGFGLRGERMVFAGEGGPRPVWVIGLGLRSSPPAFYEVVVDAVTGATLARVNLVAYAGGRAFAATSPPMAGAGCPATAAQTNVWFDATLESPLGYVDAALAGTVGNNVRAQDDRAAVDFGQLAVPTGAGRWDHVWTDSYATSGNPAPDLPAAITSLFYMNNWIHDRLYARGFDEAAGNFQRDNFGRGGLGRDPVWADAMDGSGTSNANFATDVDGIAPRMQMYLFTATRRDGDVDNSVVVHEFGHGVSHRLVGVSCLSGHEAGSMGEGWGDFLACSAFDTPVVAAYVTNDCTRGIRRASYDPATFPYTYGDICTGPFGCEVHDDGEIWAAALWDARERVAARVQDRAAAACILETLVVAGMKRTACDPTMLAARDAILAAAHEMHPELVCLLWDAFAARGMGFSATTTGAASSGGRSERFDLPAECAACAPLPAPSPLLADTSVPGAVTLTWTAVPGAVSYEVEESSDGCGETCARPDRRLLASVTGTTWTDTGLSGELQRAYFVRALRSPLCAGPPACREVVPSGRCTSLPRSTAAQTGATWVDSGATGACALVVHWAPAASTCPGGASIVYNVYRGTLPDFTPAAGNRIASVPAPATSHTDLSVQPGTTWYYVVRAEDTTSGGSGPNGGNEEGNLVRRAGSPHGAPSGSGEFFDSFDPAPQPGWTHASYPAAVPDDWAVVTDPRTGGTAAWHVGHVRAATLGYSVALKDLVLPPLVLGIGSQLVFDHKMDAEYRWDGGVIELSQDGGNSWRDLTQDIVSGGYNSTTLSMSTLLQPPNTNRIWTGTIPTGFAGFQRVTVNLSPYAGPASTLIRFRSLWDADSPTGQGMCTGTGGATYCGWYIDNVRVTAVTQFGACTPGPGCSATAVLVAQGPTRFCQGGTVRLDASQSTVLGCPGPAAYLWLQQGSAIPGATAATLDVPPTLAPGAHDFVVVVSCPADPQCAQRSAPLTVTVDAAPAMAHIDALRVSRNDVDLVLAWGVDPAALAGYHVYRTAAKAVVSGARRGEPLAALAGATLPNPLQTTFADAGYVRGAPIHPDLLYYQVLSVCADGFSEGPN